MCSSLLKVRDGTPCSGEGQMMTVPVFTLSDVLDRLPEHYDIEFCKIDAQGNDFAVIQSAGRHVKRLKRVQLEVQLNGMYKGGSEKGEVMEFMQRNGFVLHQEEKNAGSGEVNLIFFQEGVGPTDIFK